jgi:hypothetical protein
MTQCGIPSGVTETTGGFSCRKVILDRNGREVGLGEMQGYEAALALRSPRSPFVDNFLLADNPGAIASWLESNAESVASAAPRV